MYNVVIIDCMHIQSPVMMGNLEIVLVARLGECWYVAVLRNQYQNVMVFDVV